MAVAVCVCDDACKLRFDSATRHIVFLWCEDFYTLLIGYYFWVLACCEARGHHLGGIGC